MIARAKHIFYTTAMWASKRSEKAFTIVELLIVIVIIAILAAIVIVAYNGIQARASFSKAQQDLKNITKALDLYHVDHDSYPISVGQPGCTYDWCGWDQVTGDGFIDGLSPEYMSQIPQMPATNAARDTYLYRSDATGINYQLLRYKGADLGGLSDAEKDNPLSADGDYDGLAWGYRTNNTWW